MHLDMHDIYTNLLTESSHSQVPLIGTLNGDNYSNQNKTNNYTRCRLMNISTLLIGLNICITIGETN